MNTQPRQLTCYIKRTRSNPDMWEAFCVELDIPAVGDSYEEVAAMMYQAVDNYIEYVYQNQPDDEQRLLYRPMPKADVWKLQFEERFLQRLPFSNRQVRKIFLSAEKGIPIQLDPHYTELCLTCKKYRSISEFEVFHEPNSAYVWYDKTCNICKQAGVQ